MINRRTHLKWCNTCIVPFFLLSHIRTVHAKESEHEKWLSERDEWFESVQGAKAFGAPTVLSKFSDGFYYLRAPIRWSSNRSPLSIDVPEGFVTDLASIPRLFWALIPRDGSYADAAIIHDYLYWNQATTRREADQIFLLAMQDLEVSNKTSQAIFTAVRSFLGERAWNKNQELKRSGESRQLTRFPGNPAIRWIDWKKEPENLAKGH